MKKVLFSLIAIGVVVSLVGAGAFAYFSDVETSEDNTFTAGTMDMQLEDADEDWADGVTATWQSPDWKPGEEVEATLRFKNIGSITSNWLFLDLTNLTAGGGINNVEPESEPAGGGDNNLASQIHITHFEVGEVGGWTSGNYIGWLATCPPFIIVDDGIMTLEEFVDGKYGPMFYDYPALLEANSGSIAFVKMILRFDPNAGNDYQGDQCSFDLKALTFRPIPPEFWEAGGGGSGYGYGQLE